MKEFIDKLIRRLEEAKVSANRRNAFDSEVPYACVIDIVNKLAEEYKSNKVNSDLISRSEVIKELNEIYLDNPWDSKEDILEKAIGRVEHIAPYTEGE